MSIQELIDFEGKRNCALTLFIPKNSFEKCITKIEKYIYSIKHENKKKQLKKVINKVKTETNIIQENDIGMIICCGLDNNLMIKHYQLNPIKQIIEFEYFYDYKFYINKIIEKTYKNVEFIDTKEIQTWIDKINKLKKDELIIYEKEIDNYMDSNIIAKLFYFSDDIIDIYYLKQLEKYNFHIMFFTLNDVILKDIQKQYGKIIGSLHYKIDLFNC